jgi:hypothetical protein
MDVERLNDGIHFSFIKLLLPAILPVLTHIFNHIFVSSEFSGSCVADSEGQ